MRKTYKGKFKPKNPKKYIGNVNDIIYRSLWERNAMRWCDEKAEVVKWSSETIAIPYFCKTDNKAHRYFIDLYIEFSNGEKYCIEIKPKKQTLPPTRKTLNEAATYAKNTSKWDAAHNWCLDRGIKFAIWTEETLEKLGIKTFAKKFKPFKRMKRKK